MKDRDRRLAPFYRIPKFALEDHRNYLDENGEHKFISKLSRNERRALKKKGKEIGRKYDAILRNTYNSGSGFPISEVLHQYCAEYVHRLASSGARNFPVSFNFFEPFLELHIIQGSYAPYFTINPELDHLFDLSDFLDFATSENVDLFETKHLMGIPERRVYHFSANGDIFATKILDAIGREFVVSGFSMTRLGSKIHWYLLGGEILSPEEWTAQESLNVSKDFSTAPPWKRAFLTEMSEKFGSQTGLPLALEGTDTAIRTIVSGEFDIIRRVHISRAYLVELEHSFKVFTDDPTIFDGVSPSDVEDIKRSALQRLSEAGPLWNVAEALFQIPNYFSTQLTISNEIDGISTASLASGKKGGESKGRRYHYVKSLHRESGGKAGEIVRVALPHFEFETTGHWRRLSLGASGKDENGNSVLGKTWVKSDGRWKNEMAYSNVVYVKDTISAAKSNIDRIISLTKKFEAENAATVNPNGDIQELYIMRCAAMSEEVYKVGWTRNSSFDRAKELSSATGVPEAFIVAGYWKYHDAEALETEVHAALAPFRISNNREFFRVRFEVIKSSVIQSLDRLARR